MTSSTEEKSPESIRDQKKEADRARVIQALRGRIPNPSGSGCFLCAWIVEDFEKNRKLTDYPYDSNDKGIFPYLGKLAHIRLEVPRLDAKVGVGVS